MDLDEFSDDGFDDLPPDALQELENHAIQFTQAQQPQQELRRPAQHQRYSDYGWDGEEEDEDLDTTEVTNDEGLPVGRPPGSKAPQQQVPTAQPTVRSGPPPPNPRWNPSIDVSKRQTNNVNATSLASRQRMTPAGVPPPFVGSQRFQSSATPVGQLQPSQFARPPLPQTLFNASQASQAPAGQPSGNMLSALQQRVRALEGELNAARGEAAIIRTNATKAAQQHDSEVSRLKKLSAEQMAKQERIVEAAVAAEKTASTELQFLQRDLKEVNDRARRKDNSAVVLGNVTPKKTAKTWGFADGFDDMDLVPSPSKGQSKGKAGSVATHVGERTPSKGKRKRPVIDSPVTALETHTGDGDVVMMDDSRTHVLQSHAQHSAVVHVAPTPPFDVCRSIFGFIHVLTFLVPPINSRSRPHTRPATDLRRPLTLRLPLRPVHILLLHHLPEALAHGRPSPAHAASR